LQAVQLIRSKILDYAAPKWQAINPSQIQDRPFICTWDKICTKSFAERFQLTDHMKDHENPSALECRSCGKVIRHKNNLARHKRYSCGIHQFQVAAALQEKLQQLSKRDGYKSDKDTGFEKPDSSIPSLEHVPKYHFHGEEPVLSTTSLQVSIDKSRKA